MPEPTTDPAGSVPEVRPHPDRVAEALIAQHRRHLASCVWVDPGRMSGAPCLGGTRITVDTIAGLLAEGLDGDQIRGIYPDVTNEHLVAVRHFADEVAGDWAQEVDRLQSELDRTRLQAAEARTLADSYAEQLATTRREIDDYVDWSNSLTEHIPDEYDGDSAQEEIISRWLADVVAERERLRAELATARRDAAADALEWVIIADLDDDILRLRATQIRRGEHPLPVRTIPVSEPAEGGAGDGE